MNKPFFFLIWNNISYKKNILFFWEMDTIYIYKQFLIILYIYISFLMFQQINFEHSNHEILKKWYTMLYYSKGCITAGCKRKLGIFT